jgi:AGCS family alanine or glycine:cation symporter
MKRFALLFFSILLSPVLIFAQEPSGIDEKINAIFEPVTQFLQSVVFVPVTIAGFEIPFVLIWLIAGAIIFTVYMRFVNVTAFKHAIDVVSGKFDNPDDKGEVSHFQALTAALSGTVGVGNIAGVAIAVSLGGPGATFWMIIAGIFGMASKFVECSLGVMYRNVNADGTVSGGPMYYLEKGLKEKGFGGLGKVLGILFAIACIGGSFGGGNMVQINQATQQFIDVTGGAEGFMAGKGWIFGLIMAVIVAVIIIGGIKSIARVTDKIVPFMVGIYIAGALIVLGYHVTDIPAAFSQIFSVLSLLKRCMVVLSES